MFLGSLFSFLHLNASCHCFRCMCKAVICSNIVGRLCFPVAILTSWMCPPPVVPWFEVPLSSAWCVNVTQIFYSRKRKEPKKTVSMECYLCVRHFGDVYTSVPSPGTQKPSEETRLLRWEPRGIQLDSPVSPAEGLLKDALRCIRTRQRGRKNGRNAAWRSMLE